MFGAVLVAEDGSAGMASIGSFVKSSPNSALAPPLAKAELIKDSAINICKKGNLFDKHLCFGSSLVFKGCRTGREK